jgi:peptidoglycan DL-endopeptidase CwlO
VASPRALPHVALPTALRTLVVAAAVAGVVLGAADPVSATPSPGQIETQINDQWNQLEPLLEKWDAVNEQLQINRAKANKLAAAIAPLQLQVNLARTRVGVVSARMFIDGPGSTLNAVLRSGSPIVFLDQMETLNQLSQATARTVSSAATLEAAYQAQKAPLDALVANLTAQAAMLKSQQIDYQQKIDNLNRLRLAAYGSGSGTGSLRPVACPQVYTGDPGSRAASFACKQIGKPYIWADAGPGGYDCSGLTLAAWRSVGVTLPHNAYQQKQNTTRISYSSLKPGDLVFYGWDIHHVTIYVGNGWVVSAPQPGESVQMQHYNQPGTPNSYGRVH